VTVRRKATQAAEPSAFGKVVAVVSIAAWGGAVWNARLIGLFT
jgi:hypothetical protein